MAQVKTTAKMIFNTLWSAADTLRGKVDSSIYKDYILTLLFLKAISDVYKEHYEEYMERYDGKVERVKRALKRDKFILTYECTYEYLYQRRDQPDIGVTINVALEKIEEENKEKIGDIFRNIDFNSATNLGDTEERNNILKHLLIDIESLDLRPSMLDGNDVIGDAYQNLIEKFASSAGKKGGEFYTPSEVSKLVAKLADVKPNMRVYDLTCGSASLLIKAADEAGINSVSIYGQESNGQTYTLAKMNMFMHGIDDANIARGDTLAKPQFTESSTQLMVFDRIVANPPFSLDKWAMNMEGAQVEEKEKKDGTKIKKIKYNGSSDKFDRFDWGTPPMGTGDYAFVLHIVKSMSKSTGKAAVVLPHGVLFRGNTEGKIRKKLIEENLIETVVGLPANLFYGTSIPATVLVLNKNKGDNTDIFFVNASGEEFYRKEGNKSVLLLDAIKTIDEHVKGKIVKDRFSYLATYEEVAIKNEYNLNIPRYIDTFFDEELIDIDEVLIEIKSVKVEIDVLESKMEAFLHQLGL